MIVDGLIFQRGIVDDLYQKLSQIVLLPGLINRLRSGIRPPRRMGNYMQGYIQAYGRIQKKIDIERKLD